VVRLIIKAGYDTIKPKCMESGLVSGLSQYLSMYFMPYLVAVQQAEQYREGWLTAQRAHRNSRCSDRHSIPIHKCTLEVGCAVLSVTVPYLGNPHIEPI